MILGIDPGNHGALAVLDPDTHEMGIWDMPVFEFATTKNRVKIDPYSVSFIIDSLPITHAYVEDVAASPQMGVVSAFSFGRGMGVLEGVLAAKGIPLTPIKPAQWKRQMRVPADKRASVQRACQLFPALTSTFTGPKGGVMDGRGEAALIALYGALELGRAPTAPVTLMETPDARDIAA